MFYCDTKYRGFNLIELVIILFLICLGLLATMVSYQNFSKRNQLHAAANEIVTTLNMLRYQAVMTQHITSLCASKSGSNCHGNWSDGMLAFIDNNSNGQFDSGDKRLRILKFPKGLRVDWNRAAKTIQLSPSGRLKGQNGSFKLQMKKDLKLKIRLSLTGRVRLDK